MRKPVKLRTLTKEEIAEIRRLASSRTEPFRMVQRARLIARMLDDPNLYASEAGLQVGYRSPIMGVTWVRRFNAEGLGVIILSMHNSDEYVWQAWKSGAAGYLLKRAATAELAAALKGVVGGEIYLSREISGRFIKRFPLQQIARSTSPLEQLSPRQREILQLLAEGQTTKAIASNLGISDKTVEYHRAKLMAALKIFDIPGLVRFAMRTGLISAES